MSYMFDRMSKELISQSSIVTVVISHLVMRVIILRLIISTNGFENPMDVADCGTNFFTSRMLLLPFAIERIWFGRELAAIAVRQQSRPLNILNVAGQEEIAMAS